MKKKGKNDLTGHKNDWLKQILKIMKLSLLLIIIGLGNISANVFSQEAKIVDLDLKNVTLKNVMDNIEQRTNYKFIYRSDLINVNQITSIDSKEVTINELLAVLLKGTSIDYNVLNDNLIILTPQQQQGLISGKVTDVTTGEPLVGVSVVVKGTTKGTVTDMNGNYSIEVPDNAVLAFSYVGYLSEEFPATGKNIDVKLSPDIKKLEEVVVVGYGTQRKADLTGSLSAVGSKDLAKLPTSNPLQALQGKAAGVGITSVSGQPGTGYQIRIRGIQSINASVEPTYVIDGVISDNMNNISVNDIESISVLKDGASSSIYGARAANGVVLITTKHGSKNEAPVIEFHTYQGIQTNPNTRLKLLTSDQWLQLNDESYTNDGYTGAALDSHRKYTSSDLDVYKDANGNYRNTDWLKEISRTGQMQYYDLSVKGGSEKSTYFTSLNYFKQDGMIISQAAKKFNFRFNSDHKVNKFIEFGNTLNLFYNHNEGLPDFNSSNYNFDRNPYLQAIRKSPLSAVKAADGSYATNYNQNIEYEWMSPRIITDEYKRTGGSYGAIGNLYTKFNIVKGLSFMPRLSLTYQHDLFSLFFPRVDMVGTEKQTKTELTKNTNDSYHWQADYILNYDHTFNNVHNISALLVYSQEESVSEDLGGYRNGLPLNDIYYLNAGDPASMRNNNGYSDWAIISYIGRVNYDYGGKYLFQATVRRDGSSRFKKENRWAVFPSYSIGWRISKEKFFDGLSSIVNDLKLRASLGTLGNANINNNYTSYSGLSAKTTILNNQQAGGFTWENSVNTDLKWETTRKYNFGLDASLLQSKIYLTADYFISKTTDLLYRKPLPLSAGKITDPYVNGGDMQNKGWEFELGYRERKGDFSYDVSANFSAIRNKVVDLAGGNVRDAGIIMGEPYASYIGYKTNGIVKTQAELDAYRATLYNTSDADFKTQLGDVMKQDVNSYDANRKFTGIPDGKIDDADRTVIGKKYPDFTYGFVANVSYKRFSLQLQAQGVQGIDLPFTGQSLNYFSGNPTNMSNVVLERWHATANPNGDLPRLTRSDPNANADFSDAWLSNASYLRINNLNISWDLPDNICKKVLLNNLRVYFSVQNLYTFTKFKGGDPDVTFISGSYGGNPADKIPQPRTWTLGLKLSL